jgi:hypothetical protein
MGLVEPFDRSQGSGTLPARAKEKLDKQVLNLERFLEKSTGFGPRHQ